jgi:hypothetical protein
VIFEIFVLIILCSLCQIATVYVKGMHYFQGHPVFSSGLQNKGINKIPRYTYTRYAYAHRLTSPGWKNWYCCMGNSIEMVKLHGF